MEITSKQRAKLRAMASTTDTICQIGKDGISDNFIKLVDKALKARELVKFKVLESSPVTVKEAAAEVAQKTDSIVVTVIGSKAVLYRQSDDKKIEI